VISRIIKVSVRVISLSNLVPRDFSLAWGRGGKSPSQEKVPGNEVAASAFCFGLYNPYLDLDYPEPHPVIVYNRACIFNSASEKKRGSVFNV